jgi:NAD(P)H-dependent flavin oxidoreductase YrpB (nitropropane dioxygenase family)
LLPVGFIPGYDMYDIMQAGAKGVKLGTRFVTTMNAMHLYSKKVTLLCKKRRYNHHRQSGRFTWQGYLQ